VKTATSNEPAAPEALRLLGAILSERARFGERERSLERARSLRDSSRRQSLEERESLLRYQREERRRKIDETTTASCEAYEGIARIRAKRLERAGIAVRSEVVAAIQKNEGQRKALLQRDFMLAGREREASVAEAEQAVGEALAAFDALAKRGATLEKRMLRSMRGFGSLQGKLAVSLKAVDAPSQAEAGGGRQLLPDLEGFERISETIREAAERHRRSPLVTLFNGLPVAILVFLVAVLAGGLPIVSRALGGPAIPWALALGVGVVVLAACLTGYCLARRRVSAFLDSVGSDLVAARELRLRMRRQLEESHAARLREIEARFQDCREAFEFGLRKGLPERSGEAGSGGGEAARRRYDSPQEVEERTARLKERLPRHRERRLAAIRRRGELAKAAMDTEFEASLEQLRSGAGSGDLGEGELDAQLADLREERESVLGPMASDFAALCVSEAGERSDWGDWGDSADWEVPREFPGRLRFGDLRGVLPGKSGGGGVESVESPEGSEGRGDAGKGFRLPLRFEIPSAASALLECDAAKRSEALDFLNGLVLAWLASSPAGRLSFSFFDPLALGESFAGLMHLADYEEQLVHGRIRTREDQIEARLGELCEHMEKVIQMYLRNDYETITDYNEAAGSVAERYHFVVAADFPKGFSDLALSRLQSIAASGARCGVFLLLHRDARSKTPQGFSLEDLRSACLGIECDPSGWRLRGCPLAEVRTELLRAPGPERFGAWVHRLGEANRDSNRVEVPFSVIAPPAGKFWSLETSKEVRVPVGRSGATRLQWLALGKGTCQHALIAGKTGSGKSTLFHVAITNLALWHSPEEVEFYLIDFKKGVEFKCYAEARLPHARVVAIESDREFGLSVLQRLDAELRRRGELFRAAGVQDVAGFRAARPGEAMPRTLLLVDEFQEFFTLDDQVSQQAAVLLDRLVRQGRAFGIHAVLGSQTLGGAFTLARATLGQMTVRIALACNEADAYLIMDDSNPAPRLLTRPGEGIYNDRAGAVEANSPFQVVWLDEEDRDRLLDEIRKRAEASGSAGGELVVYEGNAPGDLATDRTVAAVLKQGAVTGPPTLYLGAPNSIKPATSLRLERQSGAHLLVVGRHDEAVDTLIVANLLLLRRQFGERARLVLVDPRLFGGAAGELAEGGASGDWFVDAVQAVGGVLCPGPREYGPLLNQLSAERRALAEGGGGGDSGLTTLVFVPGLHRHKSLRHEEDFSFSLEESGETKPSDSLQDLVLEGPAWGFHLVVSFDSLNSATRALGRRALGEFEKKLLFQMSASDSASLMDSGRAADLGLNRALLYDEGSGAEEVFRPWAAPSLTWLRDQRADRAVQ